MPIDPSISLGVQQPNFANTIGSFLDLGNKQLQLQRGKATYGVDVAQREAESRSAQSRATVDQANVGPLIQQQAAQTISAMAKMSQDQLQNMRAHVANGMQQLGLLIQKPDLNYNDVEQSLKDTLQSQNAPLTAYVQAFQHLPPANASPDTLRQYIKQELLAGQTIASQLDKIAPPPVFVNNGQQTVPMASGNPALTGTPAGTPQGIPVQMQVPPTAITMGPGGQPTYVGAQPNQQTPIKAGPAIGQAEGTIGPIASNNAHYTQVMAEAKDAPTRIAALQTIMQEAPKAITGGGAVGDVKRKILSSWANLYGVDTGPQTATDVMAKNLAIIAGNAGNTDAARSLGEMGTPNYHMTKEAIDQTGAQLLGIDKKKLAAQQLFQGMQTNDPAYAAIRAKWDSASDPRLFEYAALPPEDKKAWMAKLSPGVRAELAMKAKALHDLGVTP